MWTRRRRSVTGEHRSLIFPLLSSLLCGCSCLFNSTTARQQRAAVGSLYCWWCWCYTFAERKMPAHGSFFPPPARKKRAATREYYIVVPRTFTAVMQKLSKQLPGVSWCMPGTRYRFPSLAGWSSIDMRGTVWKNKCLSQVGGSDRATKKYTSTYLVVFSVLETSVNWGIQLSQKIGNTPIPPSENSENKKKYGVV